MSKDQKPAEAPPAPAVKVVMTSYMTGSDFAYAPGDIAAFDAAEAERLISVGGAKPHKNVEDEQ